MTKQPIVTFVILSLLTPGWMLCGSDTWAGYTVDRGGKVDTGDWLGWIFVNSNHHWIYTWQTGGWLYLPQSYGKNSGVWASIPEGHMSKSSIEPSNPNLIASGVELLQYLYNLSTSDASVGKLISGHWQGASFKRGLGWGYDPSEIVEIRKRTGKWIGMLDGWICPGDTAGGADWNDPIEDTMRYDDMIADYILWWENGGIIHADTSVLPASTVRWLTP